MSTVKWNPVLANRVFNEFFNTSQATPRRNHYRSNTPAVNIRETDDEFGLELAAPGLTKEDFKIEVENEILSITVGREENKETTNDKDYKRREFFYSKFSRKFTLPESADDSKISAKYQDGILYVVLPKKEEAKPQPARLIEIG